MQLTVKKVTKVIKEKDIILCDGYCNGKGTYFDMDPQDNVTCSKCNGTGRIKKMVVEAEITVPLDFDPKVSN